MDTHNERVKLFATALNNLGVGAIIAGVVVPTVSGRVGDLIHVGLWLVFGVDLVLVAQMCLGRLR
jgi:hypothetical protein